MTDRTLSTTAYRAYWLGRYLERAGNTARLVLVNANLIMDLPMRLPLGWLPLVDILALNTDFDRLYEAPDGARPANDVIEKQVARFLLSDQRHPGSLLSSLAFAKENTRALRGTLPRATYEYINETFLYAKEAFQEPLSRSRRTTGLQRALEQLEQVHGFLSSNMMHNAPWQFLRLGNFLERADMTTRLIDLRTTSLIPHASQLTPFGDIQWRSVLNSVDAMQGYTVTVQQPVNQPDVLQFLLQNEDLPRSLLRCYSAIRNCLRSLPKNTDPLEQIGAMRRQLRRANVRRLAGDRLHRYVDARQKQLSALHQKITRAYFPSA